MTVTIDQANAGSAFGTGSGAAWPSLTTTANIAAGATAFLIGGAYDTPILTWASGGGVEWVVDHQGGPMMGTTYGIWVARAYCPSGIASGSVLSVGMREGVFGDGTARDQIMGLLSFNDLVKWPTEAAMCYTGGPGSGTWATLPLTIPNGALLLGACYYGQSASTGQPHAPSAGSTEAMELDLAAHTYTHMAVTYRIEATGGSFQTGGTWNNGFPNVGIVGLAYEEDTGQSAPAVLGDGIRAGAGRWGSLAA